MGESSEESSGGGIQGKNWELNVKIPSDVMRALVEKTDDPSQYIAELLARDFGHGKKVASLENFDEFMGDLMRVSGNSQEIRDDHICIIQLLDSYRVHYKESLTVPSTQDIFHSRNESRREAREKIDERGAIPPVPGEFSSTDFDALKTQWRIWFRKAKLRSNKLMEKYGLSRFGNAYGLGPNRKHPPPPGLVTHYTQWFDENNRAASDENEGADALMRARDMNTLLLISIKKEDGELDNYTIPIDESS